MTRTWFASELETVATFWQVLRRDGLAFGLTTHDADLWFDGMLHRSSPGMVPAAIRRSGDLEPDSAEVRGALSHDSIAPADLAAGRFDGALIRIGLVDWESLERTILYSGTIGEVAEEDGSFSAELVSRKVELRRDTTPRTSPTCRALFCAPGCNLDPVRFTLDRTVLSFDAAENAVEVSDIEPADYLGGTLRWLDGPHVGQTSRIARLTAGGGLVLAEPVDTEVPPGLRVRLREGCDHTIATCGDRFGNAVNFQGEPFLPGNDLLVRYPSPQA
ncbi:hypothetical protein B2G71_00420 [Novosphingobium sp. PC22D]|uniref:DUF2163 domain-containing protein n=1 Tax=Novosphingobium sp. PC22D TaxID=1962403 RepID=UPI000BF11495|nr:DUF2163 domain-containing protein [Novosphingobium sp. PC22D]PEQ14123.1 hypothetical protein B2G71_00420 [Novosphingobium sp. PC22D]